ncbi:MAG: type II toxin-antitoxin system Phd/YefM family antitoxin [Pleurocapsa sp.]
MKIANIHEAKSQLSKLIESALAGEEIIIAKAGKPLVKLIPYQEEQKPRIPGGWEGKVTMADDFDEELPPQLLA